MNRPKKSRVRFAAAAEVVEYAAQAAEPESEPEPEPEPEPRGGDGDVTATEVLVRRRHTKRRICNTLY